MYKKLECPKCKSDNVIAKSRTDTYEGWLYGRYSAYCVKCCFLDGFFKTEYEALQFWIPKETEKRDIIQKKITLTKKFKHFFRKKT